MAKPLNSRFPAPLKRAEEAENQSRNARQASVLLRSVSEGNRTRRLLEDIKGVIKQTKTLCETSKKLCSDSRMISRRRRSRSDI